MFFRKKKSKEEIEEEKERQRERIKKDIEKGLGSKSANGAPKDAYLSVFQEKQEIPQNRVAASTKPVKKEEASKAISQKFEARMAGIPERPSTPEANERYRNFLGKIEKGRQEAEKDPAKAGTYFASLRKECGRDPYLSPEDKEGIEKAITHITKTANLTEYASVGKPKGYELPVRIQEEIKYAIQLARDGKDVEANDMFNDKIVKYGKSLSGEERKYFFMCLERVAEKLALEVKQKKDSSYSALSHDKKLEIDRALRDYESLQNEAIRLAGNLPVKDFYTANGKKRLS